jgi:MFS family permease
MQLMEVPSGALADSFGRRRAMVLAFIAYVSAYLLLGLAPGFAMLAVGMGLIGFGDAFRTGTHKAMIFDWLRRQGRQDDKVKVYGFTRSWSKIGSLVAIPIAVGIAIVTGRYAYSFMLSAIPSAVDAINLGTYPRELDGEGAGTSWRGAYKTLRNALRRVWKQASLRRLLFQAMAFGGSYKAIKDYVQPLIVTAVATTAFATQLQPQHRTAATTGAVYMVLFGLGAIAARNAHRFVERFDDARRAVGVLWWVVIGVLVTLLTALIVGQSWLAIAMFVLLGALFDVFRPALVSRIDDVTSDEGEATILSLESQGTSTATAVVALVVGATIDALSGGDHTTLWPTAAAALVLVVPAAMVAWLGRDH